MTKNTAPTYHDHDDNGDDASCWCGKEAFLLGQCSEHYAHAVEVLAQVAAYNTPKD